MPIPALVNALQALGAAFSVGHASSAAGGAVAATGAAKDTGVATAAATSSTVSSATGGVKAASLGSALKASAVGTLDVSKDVWTGVKVSAFAAGTIGAARLAGFTTTKEAREEGEDRQEKTKEEAGATATQAIAESRETDKADAPIDS